MSNSNDNTKKRSFLALCGDVFTVPLEVSVKTGVNSLKILEVAGDGIEATADFLKTDAKDALNLARRNIRAMAWTSEREQRKEFYKEYGIKKDILEMSKEDFYKALDEKESNEQKKEEEKTQEPEATELTEEQIMELMKAKYAANPEGFIKLAAMAEKFLAEELKKN